MIETPDPEDQNQGLAEPAMGQETDKSSEIQAPLVTEEKEAALASPLLQEQAATSEQTPNVHPAPVTTDEDEDKEDEDKEQKKKDESEQERAARQKERLEDQGRYAEEASSQLQRKMRQREDERSIEFGKRSISLLKIEGRGLQEVDSLFVEPQGYQQFEQRIRQSTEEHVLVIAGQQDSGKMMTALYLAQRLRPGKTLDFYLFLDRKKTLLEIITDEKLPGNAVILFDMVFGRDQIRPDELSSRIVHLNEKLARLSNVWFIFTVLNGPILDVLQTRNFPILHTTGVNCQRVVEKLVDYHFPESYLWNGNERASLLAAKEELNPTLTPTDVRQLFDTNLNDPKMLVILLKQKEKLYHKAAHAWFDGLEPMNCKLYALLVVLFDKLDIPTLEDIYTVAVNELRRQGMDGPDEFIDPRRIGTDTMRLRLGIQVRLNTLEFRNRMYRQYAEAQIENFQRLLWSLIDPDDPSTFSGLVGVIHRLSEYNKKLASRSERDARYIASSDQLWQLSSAIAVMIAQVGVYHLPKLDLLLGKLVHDDSALVSLTAAFVLAEIARRGEQFDFIEKSLKAWSQSGNFNQMWAAAASVAYVYETIARTLETDSVPLNEEDEEAEEERKAPTTQGQKRRWKGYLAKLRDILTELVKVHDHFSKESINEERSDIYAAYRLRLRQLLEADSEPLIDDSRSFKDLSEVEQERYLNLVYIERKREIDEAVERDINLLTNSWRNQMRMVLMQALGQIAQMRPRDITRLIHVWLDRKDTENPLWQIGHMALNYLFRESAMLKDASLLEQSAYPLLDLLPMALRTHTLTVEAFIHDINLFRQLEDLEETGTLGQHVEVGNLLRNDPLVYALYAIQRWHENLSHLSARQGNGLDEENGSEEDEEDEIQGSAAASALQKRWQQIVYSVLSNAMNSAAQEERQRLRGVLFLWVKSREMMLNRMARILIAHSYVMDGVVLDLPASKRFGVVVIDDDRREQEDREQIFYLLQNLSAIAPIHLRWLGFTESSRFLSSDNRDEVGNQHSDGSISSFDPDDLLFRGASRPSLLIPVMVSRQGKEYMPEQCYFVTVFHTEPILDLDELYKNTPDPVEERKGNLFQQYRQHQQAASQSLLQPWRDKVYLLPSSKLDLPSSLSTLLTVVRPRSIGVLEEELRRRVTITLRTCSTEELWRDLRAYMGVPETRSRTFTSMASDIDRWLEQLSDTSTLYPDVSLFILWTIMVRSLENLAEAIPLIERMLEDKAEEAEEKVAKRARKLRLQMGIACTRMLFHFYGVDNPTLAAGQYGVLLNLLPQVIARASSYTEILPILSILFQLARSADWLQILNENDGAFSDCINKLQLKDIMPLRNWLKFYQRYIAMGRLFIDYNGSFSDFCSFGEEIFRRYKVQPQKQSARKLLPPGEMAHKFLALLPAENDQEDKARYTWALQQIEFQQSQLRNPDYIATALEGLKNQEMLFNHLNNEFQVRLDGKIEQLKQGEYYWVVMVEAQSKAAVHQAFLFIQKFVEQRRQSKGQHITLTLQRLGEKEMLAKVRNNRKIRNEREIIDKRKLPQLIGPLLERYPIDQVGFVVLITAAPIIDYDDWAEQEGWASRLLVARLGKWHPYRGEIISLGESTQLTVETLLKRVTQEE